MKKAQMPRHKWTSGRGVLWIIAMMFIASAAVRFGAGPGQAIAKEVAAISSGQPDAQTPAQCVNPPDIEALLAALATRTEFLDKRQKKLEEYEQSLAFAKDRVQENIDALAAAEQKLTSTIAVTETAAENDLARLTSVYENMKPKQAATLFEEMSPEFAAGFVGRMRPDAAAQIMAGLSPQAAYTISVILAGRNARAPTK
jgi:flagellar motility protein MotE (MotC chaperone)